MPRWDFKKYFLVKGSVAEIPDPNFFHPGSRVKNIPDPHKII
jgi:hypothetical protein